MKSPFLIWCFLALATPLLAQVNADSIQQEVTTITEKTDIDALEQQLPHLPDSLLPSYEKVDSIRTAFNQEADSIKADYQSAMSELESQQNKVTDKIDSLQQLDLPTDKYTHKLDSLNQLRQTTEAKFTSKLDDLKSKTTGKLNALDLPPQYQEPIQALTKNVDGLNLNSETLKIPSLEIPGYSLPDLDGLGDITSKVGDIGKIGDLGALPKIETPVGDLGQVTEQAKVYQDDIKNITQGNLGDVKELPKTVEQKAAEFAGVDELQKEAGVLDEYKSQADALADPETGKEKAVEVAKKAAVNHFAGKEEQLKAAMDKMSKYKQKYSSVSSIKDLPKRPPNAMKGKPFVERLVPGLFFQYQQKRYNLFDFNPYLGYKISGRFTAGAGWNQRFAYNRAGHSWSDVGIVYGPRIYVDTKLGKGFIAHVESEVMNTFVPSVLGGNPELGHREWVWSMMMGLKKEYKIYKSLRGTVLIQYNIFNREYKAPYVDRLNSRIGFEYVLKKKKKKSS